MGDSLQDAGQRVNALCRVTRIYMDALAEIAVGSIEPASRELAMRALRDAASFIEERSEP